MNNPRGGVRPGAGRHVGSTKPDTRYRRLMQRYNDDEIARITLAAERDGRTVSDYIREVVLYAAR